MAYPDMNEPRLETIKIIQYDNTGFYRRFVLTDNYGYNRQDLTGGALSLNLKADQDGAVLISCTEANGRISVGSPRSLGEFQLNISDTDFAPHDGLILRGNLVFTLDGVIKVHCTLFEFDVRVGS
jgi:hypothetical protein